MAVHNDTGLLAAYDLFTDKSSSAMLTTLMRDSVTHAGSELSDIDAIVVAKGPGSYTGLRVGVSTAKGLCYALDKPLIAINTLQAMALQLAPFFPGRALVGLPSDAILRGGGSFHCMSQQLPATA